jgi:hypothetical protein
MGPHPPATCHRRTPNLPRRHRQVLMLKEWQKNCKDQNYTVPELVIFFSFFLFFFFYFYFYLFICLFTF